ncbi:hypothetical protein LZ554_000599 [Drepanopeziza brunnea f. sp. 'monogermtubi']|nr:hypothetical protein LZ554_000599 [Drepanopeziza brunnea f. sp. 'monogermtubi']
MNSSAEEPFLAQETEPRRRHSRWPRISTIILSTTTLVFGILSIFLLNQLQACSVQTFKDGYSTDWVPAKASIELQKVTYTSAFRYNATSQGYYREFDPAAPKYIGEPSEEIDAAWMELLGGQYLELSEEEAMQLDDPVSIKGTYYGEVEVMHSLHCLNAIRKAMSPEYYSKHGMYHLPKDLEKIHVEHCFEQLRQNLQCAGDLTPLLLRPYGVEPNVNLIGTPQTHTCRNWEVFRAWWTERGLKHGSFNKRGI